MELKDFLDIAFLIIIVNEESQQLQSDKGNVNRIQMKIGRIPPGKVGI